MKNSPLNRKTAPEIVRFFDVCFKQGVISACHFGDDYGVKDFINAHKPNFSFGVLGEPDDYDWQSFRFALYRWARASRQTTLAENYIYQIRKKDALWCFLPYCMRFYIMGMEEWLKYPNPVGIELFKKTIKVHWDPTNPVRKFTTYDFIAYLQEFALDYRRLPDELHPINPYTMDGFCTAIHDLTRSYATGKKF